MTSKVTERSSSTGYDQDENWDDWVDENQQNETTSLFDGTTLPSPQAALKYDKEKHDFDLVALEGRLGEL